MGLFDFENCLGKRHNSTPLSLPLRIAPSPLLQVPDSWSSCAALSNAPQQRLPARAADVRVTTGAGVGAVQAEGCAARGVGVNLGMGTVSSGTASGRWKGN